MGPALREMRSSFGEPGGFSASRALVSEASWYLWALSSLPPAQPALSRPRPPRLPEPTKCLKGPQSTMKIMESCSVLPPSSHYKVTNFRRHQPHGTKSRTSQTPTSKTDGSCDGKATAIVTSAPQCAQSSTMLLPKVSTREAQP